MKKLSYVLIIILLGSFLHILPINSQPNGCLNINGLKTPELIAQFEAWLNEPEGLNARFLDGIESSFERGQRQFYNLFLNNNQICLSDLNQEMIDSINEVIRSYDDADNHFYIVDGLQVSRNEINLGFKAIRDPVILGKKIGLFAEAIQILKPIEDSFVSDQWFRHTVVFTTACDIITANCWAHVDSNPFPSGGLTDHIHSITNPIITSEEGVEFNNTGIIDPQSNINHNLNITFGKETSAGRQIDINFTLTQSENGTLIKNHIEIDVGNPAINSLVALSGAEADSITNYNDLFGEIGARGVGGGAGREGNVSYFTLEIPDPPINELPTISNATLWGLFNTTDTLYSILSFDGRDKVFQDMQVRLNLTVTDPDGRNNITQVHALFNSTFLMSFYNDSGTFIFNTTTPLIVENLEGLNTEITDGWNITFIFSLSNQLGHGYYWLNNANVTDNNSNATLVRERWFSFIREPDIAVSSGTSGLFPLAPLLQIFFIVGGFWFILGAKGRIELQATGLFFFLASMLFIISPIYAVIDSNDNLSYVILNYPDAIRNNFVLINLTILGLGLTNVIINNRQRVGL